MLLCRELHPSMAVRRGQACRVGARPSSMIYTLVLDLQLPFTCHAGRSKSNNEASTPPLYSHREFLLLSTNITIAADPLRRPCSPCFCHFTTVLPGPLATGTRDTMSHILCVWADMDEQARQWHEKKKIPEVANQLGARALHFQVQDNPFEEPHKITSEWFTLYDGLDAKTVKALSEQLGSQEHPFSGAPKRAYFNVHHCEELACWTTKNYRESKC